VPAIGSVRTRNASGLALVESPISAIDTTIARHRGLSCFSASSSATSPHTGSAPTASGVSFYASCGSPSPFVPSPKAHLRGSLLQEGSRFSNTPNGIEGQPGRALRVLLTLRSFFSYVAAASPSPCPLHGFLAYPGIAPPAALLLSLAPPDDIKAILYQPDRHSLEEVSKITVLFSFSLSHRRAIQGLDVSPAS